MESKDPRGDAPSEGFETQAIHGGDLDDPFRALTSPLYMTSTYTFPSVEAMGSVLSGEREGFVYSRAGNPTVGAMAALVARLEGGEAGVAFASGMGAIAAVLFYLAKSRLPLIVSRHLYTGTRHFVSEMLAPLGIPVKEVDLRSTEGNFGEFREALRAGAGGVFCETPSNPSLDIVDLSAVAALCAEWGVPLAVDNTFPSPALQNPLRQGATLVVHSATKYLGGHGDLLGGVAVGSAEVIRKIATVEAPLLGATLSPMNAWLILRGIKTLALRMEAHTLRATALARFFKEQSAVVDVRYPGACLSPGPRDRPSPDEGIRGHAVGGLRGGEASPQLHECPPGDPDRGEPGGPGLSCRAPRHHEPPGVFRPGEGAHGGSRGACSPFRGAGKSRRSFRRCRPGPSEPLEVDSGKPGPLEKDESLP